MKGLILLGNNFEDAEAIVTIDLIKRAKINIDTISTESTNLVISKYGLNISADGQIDKVNLNDYDFLIIPGGQAVFTHLENKKVLDTVMHFENKNQLIAAICAAPSILGKLGLLDNQEFTCFPTMESYMPKGIYRNDLDVVTSNNHITSKAAGTTYKFAAEIIKYLLSQEVSEKVLNEIYY